MALEQEIAFKNSLTVRRIQQRALEAREWEQMTAQASVVQEKPAGGISFPRFYIALVISIIGEFFDVSWIGAVIANGLVFLLTGFKAGKGKKKLMTGLLIEFIPGVNVIPARTAGLILAYIASNPKIAQKLGTAAKIVKYIPAPQAQAVAKGLQIASTAAQASQGSVGSAAMQYGRGFATTGGPKTASPDRRGFSTQPVQGAASAQTLPATAQ